MGIERPAGCIVCKDTEKGKAIDFLKQKRLDTFHS